MKQILTLTLGVSLLFAGAPVLLAQNARTPHFVDRTIDTRPVRFGWGARTRADKEGLALAIRAGATWSSLGNLPGAGNPGTISQNATARWAAGYTAGLIAELPFADRLYAQTELDFTKSATHYQDGGQLSRFYMNSLELPVIVKYKPFEGLSVYAGPQVYYITSAVLDYKTAGTENTSSIRGNFSPLGFSALAGIGYGFAPGFGLDLRYSQNLQTLASARVNQMPGVPVSTMRQLSFTLRYYFIEF